LFNATAADYTVGKFPVTYTFRLNLTVNVTKGAYLKLEMPEEVRVTDKVGLKRKCPRLSISGFSNSHVNCIHEEVGHIIDITDGFKYAALTWTDTENPPTLVFTIPFLKNPRSMKPSGSFKITLYDSSKKVLQS